MPSIIIPPVLEYGATIAWVSPSFRLNEKYPAVMARATLVLRNRGYKVSELFNTDTSIQSSITNRLSELRTAFEDPEISAIICTIGGWSFTELLPSLIADKELHSIIRANPKIVVGYSDITGLHWFLHAITGLRTFYGPGAVPELGENSSVDDETSPLAFSTQQLFRTIASREPIYDIARSPKYIPKCASFFTDPSSTEPPETLPTTGWTWIRPGKGQGRLFGGCLEVMVRLNGVPSITPDWKGRIVFLETSIGGADDMSAIPLHQVQYELADLIAQGVFEEVAGLVIARPFGYDTPESKEEFIGIIKGLLCEGPMSMKQFPILFNVDFGHAAPIVTLPFDTLAILDSEQDKFAVIEHAVL